MNQLISLMVQIGIFLICAQSIIHFVPGKKYEQYIRAIVKVMLLAQFLIPLSQFIQWTTSDEIEEQIKLFTEEYESNLSKDIDVDETIYKEVMLEVKREMAEKLEPTARKYGYHIRNVRVADENNQNDIQNLEVVEITIIEADDTNNQIIKPVQIKPISFSQKTIKEEYEDENIIKMRTQMEQKLELSDNQIKIVLEKMGES